MVVYMQERKSIFEEYQYNSNLQVLLLLHVN